MRLMMVMPTGMQVGYDDYFSSSPLGIETLAAHATPYADVMLADMRCTGHDIEAHARRLLADDPDIIGISLNAAPHTKYALALAQMLKNHRPEVKLMVGGQQATFLADEMLAPGGFDAVIRGEGELTLEEILRNKAEWRGIAGVSWRGCGGAITHEPDRPQITDLDTVLPPRRDLLKDRSRYRMGQYRLEGVETSRGCPHKCSFCSIRNFHRGIWRPKSPARVLKEIDFILENYPEKKVIYFADDSFATNINHVREICKGIIERRASTFFWCQARADVLTKHPDVVELMGKAHFTAVLVGLETPVDRLLKMAKKGSSADAINQTIKLLHKHDIGVWGTFTLGLPGETPEETEATAKFIPTCKVDVAQITVATPIPGSELYDQAKAKGEILVTDWDQYDFTSPTMKGQLSKKKLDSLMQIAYLRTYMSGRFLLSLFANETNLSRLRRTIFGVFGSWTWFIIKNQLAGLLGLGKLLPQSDKPTSSETSSGDSHRPSSQ